MIPLKQKDETHNRLGKRARMGQASLSKRVTVATRFKEDDLQGSAFMVQDPERCRYDVTEDFVRMQYQALNSALKGLEDQLREDGHEEAAEWMAMKCFPLAWFQDRFNLTDQELERIREPLEEKGLLNEPQPMSERPDQEGGA